MTSSCQTASRASAQVSASLRYRHARRLCLARAVGARLLAASAATLTLPCPFRQFADDIDLEDAPSSQPSDDEGVSGEGDEYEDLDTDELGIADDEFDLSDLEAGPSDDSQDDSGSGSEGEDEDRQGTGANAGPRGGAAGKAAQAVAGKSAKQQALAGSEAPSSGDEGSEVLEEDGSEEATSSGSGDEDGSDGDAEGQKRTATDADPEARKGASVARAMAKILGRPVKGVGQGSGTVQGASQAGDAAGKVTARGLTGDAAILAVCNASTDPFILHGFLSIHCAPADRQVYMRDNLYLGERRSPVCATSVPTHHYLCCLRVCVPYTGAQHASQACCLIDICVCTCICTCRSPVRITSVSWRRQKQPQPTEQLRKRG